MNEHENQTMKIFGKRLTASLLGAALVMSMPVCVRADTEEHYRRAWCYGLCG